MIFNLSNKKIVPCILIFLSFINCKTYNKEEKIIHDILVAERTGTQSKKYYEQSKTFIEAKWKKDMISEMNEKFIEYKIYNDGVFYNRSEDTIFILTSGEFWIKQDIKLPDSIIDKKERFIITQCFLGVKEQDSFKYYDHFNDHIHGKKASINKSLYNDNYKEVILSKFINHSIRNKNTYYSIKDSHGEEVNFKPYKPLELLSK